MLMRDTPIRIQQRLDQQRVDLVSCGQRRLTSLALLTLLAVEPKGAHAQTRASPAAAEAPAEAAADEAAVESAKAPNDEDPWLLSALMLGPTPGSPPGGKVATVATLYGLAAASLVSTGLFTYWYFDARATEESIDQRGACIELTNETCQRWLDVREERRNHASWATLSGAASVTFMLTGLVTAHYWSNAPLTATISPSEAAVRWHLQF